MTRQDFSYTIYELQKIYREMSTEEVRLKKKIENLIEFLFLSQGYRKKDNQSRPKI